MAFQNWGVGKWLKKSEVKGSHTSLVTKTDE